MVVNILENWSHRYVSHYNAIKCVSFDSIHYVINIDVVSSSMDFNEFDCVSIKCIASLNQ